MTFGEKTYAECMISVKNMVIVNRDIFLSSWGSFTRPIPAEGVIIA